MRTRDEIKANAAVPPLLKSPRLLDIIMISGLLP